MGNSQNLQSQTAKTENSKTASKEIAELIPGGVNSPFRSFHEVGGHTIFLKDAHGSKVTDIDGNIYIDYLGAWGPAILGHSPPSVVKACQEAVNAGAVFGAPTLLELEMAKSVIRHFPSIDQIRFVSSGTEAVMSAIRLARGFTGRDVVVMFEGAYHGHSDSVLGSTTHQSSSGVLNGTKERTVLTPFNDLERLEATLEEHSGQTSAVIIEPVCGSMGVVLPEPGFLQGVRKLCDKHQVVLIFDEVLTGLRVAKGGAQALFGVKPDLTTFGKALGGVCQSEHMVGGATLWMRLCRLVRCIKREHSRATLSLWPVASKCCACWTMMLFMKHLKRARLSFSRESASL